MTLDEFKQLAEQGYTRIPITREVLADLDTPLSTYLKLANTPYSYLFESVQGGEKWGRYSIIGLSAQTVIKITGYTVQVFENENLLSEETVRDPLRWIEHFQQQFRVPTRAGLPRFVGGLVGYFGYDTVRYIEPRLASVDKPDPLGTPDIVLMVSDEVVVFDNLMGKLYFTLHVDPREVNAFAQAQARLDELLIQLRGEIPPQPTCAPYTVQESDFKSNFTQADYEAVVTRAKEYIMSGDMMQVVLSQRMSIPCPLPPLNIYRALRCLNPSPYMFYLQLADFQIVGSSPEILVRLEGDELTVRPLAGTRPRGRTPEQDVALEAELLADPKERAEHLMLIDLGRNDLGRVAQIGSVKVTEQMVVERYSHVMHIVSNVNARIKSCLTGLDALRATFPAGTLSGAPKIRAMEIIDECEPVKRGIYAGAVGYLAWHGEMDTAIAIRTAVIKNEMLYIQAGAGIVADSVPAQEWEETLNKGRAMFRAVAMAATGFA